jgi:hypothetical protein
MERTHSKSEVARHQLRHELVKFVEADSQLRELNSRCNECRKQKKDCQERLSDIGKILNLEGRKLNYSNNTIKFTYDTPKTGLSQSILRESLTLYFGNTNKWRHLDADSITDEVLQMIELLKEKKMSEKEKSLKISIDVGK